jgi:hypothetical protein
MTRLLKTIIPTILSILTVWGLLKLEAIFHNQQIRPDEDLHIDSELILLPLTIIALFIQVIFTNPIWNKFKKNRKILGLTLSHFFIALCITGGVTFGLLIWRQQFGINDLYISSLIGIIALAAYWTTNLLTLNQLDKWTTE